MKIVKTLDSHRFHAIPFAKFQRRYDMRRFMLLIAILASACSTSGPSSGQAGGSPAGLRLETTPRHQEWIQIPRPGRTLHAYVSFPEVSSKAPAVLLIHENRGLTDWERGLADQLAEKGFIAIAPDMLSGLAPGGGKATDFPSLDAAREAISRLPADQVMGDLNAAADYVLALPSANGTLSVAGFCWGGSRSFLFANQRPGLHAAFVFYGTGPQDPAGVAGITAPVYGFYGGSDARVNATIPKTEELMAGAGKRFVKAIYEGAGHAFMRAGEAADASPENRRARDQAWVRWLELLR